MHVSKSAIVHIAALAVFSAQSTLAENVPRRNLRAEHNGEDHTHSPQTAPAADAAPFVNDAARLASDAANNAAQWANSAGQFGNNDWIPNFGFDAIPGAAVPSATNTNLNFAPFTFSRSVDIGPGSVKANVGVGLSLGSPLTPPTAPVAAGASSTVTATTAPTTGSVGSGINFNPIAAAATLAHEAHGAVLGHTGTLPSSFMQNQAGGGASHH